MALSTHNRGTLCWKSLSKPKVRVNESGFNNCRGFSYIYKNVLYDDEFIIVSQINVEITRTVNFVCLTKLFA